METEESPGGMGGFDAGLLIILTLHGLGVLFALAGVARREPRAWRGLLLNGPLVLAFGRVAWLVWMGPARFT